MTPAQRILDKLSRGAQRVVVPHLSGSLRAHVAAELMLKGKRVVMVGRDQDDAEGWFRDLAFMMGTTDEDGAERGLCFLGADEDSPYEERTPDSRAVMERLATLYRLAKEKERVRAVVVTPRALVRRLVAPSYFDRTYDYIVSGGEIDREAMLGRLVASGYNAVTSVEDPGTFSVRGGIIDVFTPHRSKPLRIDLFGDEVESLRLFDPISQRTSEKIEDAVLLPAREIGFDDAVAKHARARIEALSEVALIPTRKLNAVLEDVENHIHYFGIETILPVFHPEGLVGADEYLPTGDDVVYLIGDPEAVGVAFEDAATETRVAYERALAAHQLAVPPEEHLIDGDAVLDRAAAKSPRVEMPELAVGEGARLSIQWEGTDDVRSDILKATRTKTEGDDILQPLVERLRRWRSDGLTTLIVCQTRGQAERLRALLEPKRLHVRLYPEPFALPDFIGANARAKGVQSKLRDRNVHAWIVLGDVSGGFVLKEGYLAVLSEEEIFGQRNKRRRRRANAGQAVSGLEDLKPGDFVVHVDFGIGHYLGMTNLAVNGVDSDFLNIEYKGGDKLYLPVHRLRLVSKYIGGEEGRTPLLDKLGGTSWATTKRKVKDTLLRMAAELLRLYAVRESLVGHALPPPEETFRQFEAEFPFEPTPDQLTAIADTVADLQKSSPMDRLICGDVGYGKTEVAMRATMLAVLGKKQVAVLVPTTVLAAQHHTVFKERFASYGVNIGIVSRFQSKEEVKATLTDLEKGTVDVVIGTHRLLGKEVRFADLGLLVIDEEHRFGVVHKERLKKYRTHVHVLSMSATPIPRTLHMGFMGVRDMSMIATAPQDRLAVKTEVHKFGEEVIRDAVLREIRRGGQCFVVHNRVASIGAFAKLLERLVPEARVVIGHGQMGEDLLEKVMVDFMNKQFNVLLSTTIIESGIDITNANTIIINRADRMGLAQLYQLRGRVGRGKSRGFAYFLIPAGNLTKKARARIAVLQRFTELGSGFKVASKDLEIRGAGNILGKQQSGTISAVGFEMYQALLQEAIAELAGSHRRSLKEPEINVPVAAFIPDAYVPAPGERLSFYQRFNNADTDEAAYDLLQEITDLYGNPPAEVENLAELMMVKQRLTRVGALGLDYGAQTKSMPPRVVIRFDAEEPGVTPAMLVKLVSSAARRRRLSPEGKLVIHLQPFEDPRDIMHQARTELDELLAIKARLSS